MGIRVGMGVDGEASANLVAPFEGMRIGIYTICDKCENSTIMSPDQVLWVHTMGAANVLNVKDKLGSLEPGKFADFFVIAPEQLGAVLEDPYANLVFAASERDSDSAHVGGELAVEHNIILHHDLANAKGESDRRVLAHHGFTPLYPYTMDLEITIEQLRAHLASEQPPLLLDVREPWEFATARIEGSTHMPMNEIPGRAHQELDDEAHILVLCHHGSRSLSVAAWLRQQGFDKAQSISGGINAWSLRIDPTIPCY